MKKLFIFFQNFGLFIIFMIKNWSGCVNSEFLSEEQQRRLLSELCLNDSQKKSFRKFKKKLNSENVKLKAYFFCFNLVNNFFFRFLENIFSMKKNLQKQTLNIDNAVDELRNSFSPLQITKFLLFVEKVWFKCFWFIFIIFKPKKIKEKKSMRMNLTKIIIPPDNNFVKIDFNILNILNILIISF